MSMSGRGLAVLLVIISFWSQPLWAARPAESGLFAAPAAEFGLSAELLTAIAKVESGLNPWAVNIAGRGYQCVSREEALARAEKARAAGLSFDIGIMQINNWWLDKTGLSLDAALEPQTNIQFGSWILKQELERFGDVRRAVGAYHSPRPHRAGPYADRVLAALNKNVKAAPYPASEQLQAGPEGLPAKGLKAAGFRLKTHQTMKVRKRHE